MAAFQAWTRDKSRTLADHLIAPGTSTLPGALPSRRWSRCIWKGTAATWRRAWPRSPPDRSTRESLAALPIPTSRPRSHGSPGARPRPKPATTPTGPPATPSAGHLRGQRFRVLRPHARGGLGAVFVALDAELNREVALKQILDRHADDPASRRGSCSRRRSPAGWSIPGIVPVYGLGTYDGGRPYYAMRFIRGDSLKEAIERFHADEALAAATPAAARWSCAACWAVRRRLQRRSSTPTAGACSTATSSRET